ncbi:MAG: response regulator [bacterium]|nr:response regulator [bacterium]
MTSTPNTSNARQGEPTILIVEDDPAMRTLLEHYLRQQNYKVILTSDGSSALAYFEPENQPPDIVVTDVNLPGMNGYELIIEFRKRGFNPPVVLLTGYSLDEFDLPENLKVDAILKKPIRLGDLAEVIKRILKTTG